MKHSIARQISGIFIALMVLVISLICLKIFGFRYSGALSILAGLMELIPMIGSGLMYILMGIVFFLTGNTVWGIQVLALTGVLQLLRRILEPKLMSDSIGISPLLSLIGMFVGMRFGGIIGLIGGPVAMAVLVGAVRGDVFKNVNTDIYTLVEWFKRRWAKPADAEQNVNAAEEVLSEEKNTKTAGASEAEKDITAGEELSDGTDPAEAPATREEK